VYRLPPRTFNASNWLSASRRLFPFPSFLANAPKAVLTERLRLPAASRLSTGNFRRALGEAIRFSFETGGALRYREDDEAGTASDKLLHEERAR
jgi:hypothetical protein